MINSGLELRLKVKSPAPREVLQMISERTPARELYNSIHRMNSRPFTPQPHKPRQSTIHITIETPDPCIGTFNTPRLFCQGARPKSLIRKLGRAWRLSKPLSDQARSHCLLVSDGIPSEQIMIIAVRVSEREVQRKNRIATLGFWI